LLLRHPGRLRNCRNGRPGGRRRLEELLTSRWSLPGHHGSAGSGSSTPWGSPG
jgi:hypothetical protein